MPRLRSEFEVRIVIIELEEKAATGELKIAEVVLTVGIVLGRECIERGAIALGCVGCVNERHISSTQSTRRHGVSKCGEKAVVILLPAGWSSRGSGTVVHCCGPVWSWRCAARQTLLPSVRVGPESSSIQTKLSERQTN